MSDKFILTAKTSQWSRLIARKWLVEIIATVPPVVVAFVAGYQLVATPEKKILGFTLYAAATWLVFAGLAKTLNALETEKVADEKFDHDGLQASMLVLTASAGHACGLTLQNRKTLRATFLRAVPSNKVVQTLEQIVPYCGGDAGDGGTGRQFNVSRGISGLCFRTRDLQTWHMEEGKDNEYYVQRLKQTWGYDDVEAAARKKDVLSFMAIPVLDMSGAHAFGVIYLDGKLPAMFADEKIQISIRESCEGVSQYVRQRYGS